MFAVLTLTAPPCRDTETKYDLAANDFYWFRRKQNLPCTRIHIVVSGPTHHILELLSTALSTPSTLAAPQVEGPIYILAGAAASQPDEDRSKDSTSGRDAWWSIYTSHRETMRCKAAATKVQAPAFGAGADSGSVKELIATRLSKLLWIPRERLRLDVSLSSLGIDSMIASEFRSWIQQTFHKSVGMLELLAQQTTVEKLAGVLRGLDGT
jgi:acyl carrier protein